MKSSKAFLFNPKVKQSDAVMPHSVSLLQTFLITNLLCPVALRNSPRLYARVPRRRLVEYAPPGVYVAIVGIQWPWATPLPNSKKEHGWLQLLTTRMEWL